MEPVARRTFARTLTIGVSLGVLMGSASVPAYEITTHALIAYRAHLRSVLNPNDPTSIVPVLGFDRLDPTEPFTNTYFDNQATSDSPAQFTVSQQRQELAVFRALIDANRIAGVANAEALQYRTDGWLMQGDIREDDNDFLRPVIGGYTTTDQREPDPWGGLLRAGRHFYDPIYNRPFDYPDVCSTYGCILSPVWAMGTQHPLSPPNDVEDTARRNHFTWVDARSNYWKALTLERYVGGGTANERFGSSFERKQRWATAIASLGHVIHLLQDGAQPQHTRNDSHAPPLVSYGRNAPNGAAYEAFTDYRVTGNAGGYINNPLRSMSDNLPSASQLPPLVFDGYPVPSFALPVKFFTTKYDDPGTGESAINARKGLVDFSNRNFFTTGTYPGFRQCMPPGSLPCTRETAVTYPLPENDILDTSVYTPVQIPGSIIVNGQSVVMTVYTRKAVDSVNPSYVDRLPSQYAGRVPVVTKSTFADMPGDPPAGIITNLQYNNFIADADVLLPRAVAYSAGMINYFFRGRIKVEPPLDGLFAVTDHSLPHSVDADGYPRCSQDVPSPIGGDPPLCTSGAIYGFTRLRVKLRNDTAEIVESGTGVHVPQSLAATSATPGNNDPRLVAVARYHRNPCYQPNLSGEVVVDANGVVITPTCAAGNRTTYQEISVSKPATIAAGDLNGSTSVPVSFDFSQDPIPVNATDLFVQVVYRGPLGQEQDGIAVGTYDVREPSYLTLWNNSDYAGCNGQWVTHDSPGCSYGSGGTAQRSINTARLCIGTQLLYTRFMTGGNGVIGTGGLARLVALLDDQPHSIRGRLLVGVANTLEIRTRTIEGQIRQASKEEVIPPNMYVPEPMFTKRGLVGSFQPLPFYLIIGADPQPANDAGALDVGNLTPGFSPTTLPSQGGSLTFESTPVSIGTCTSTSNAPFFEDEIEAVANSSLEVNGSGAAAQEH